MNTNIGISDTIHFVGIGGNGMSGIAEVMNDLGYKVQGSDLCANIKTKRLEAKGIKISASHDPINVRNATFIVVSSAINLDNCEIVAARENNIPVRKRSAMLAELMRSKFSISISGSHGKTTTTAIVACLFEAAGLYPTVINGGIMNHRSTNAYLGQSDYIVVEADESDATFIKIPSTIGVITNINPEHLDYYGNFDALITAFKTFIRNLPTNGFGVACVDHPVVRNLVEDVSAERRILTYGIESNDAHILAYNIKLNTYSSTFDIQQKLPNTAGPTIIEHITIPTPGKHNVLNALAAIAIGMELNFGIKVIKNGFKNFQGVIGRFTKVHEYRGAEIIDDSATHPVEIAATLTTASQLVSSRGGRVIAIFQPHKYTRLKNLFWDFVNCFTNADIVYVTALDTAGEQPIEGVNARELANAIRQVRDKTTFIDKLDDVPNIIASEAIEGDIFVIMGGGTIIHLTNQLPKLLG